MQIDPTMPFKETLKIKSHFRNDNHKKKNRNSFITQETHHGYIWHFDVKVELSGIVQFTDIQRVTIAL